MIDGGANWFSRGLDENTKIYCILVHANKFKFVLPFCLSCCAVLPVSAVLNRDYMDQLSP